MALHPVARLLLWTAGVVVLQSIGEAALLAAGTAAVLAASLFAPARAWRLARRARWLLIALVTVFAWSTPGRLVWPDAGWMSPSAEGLLLALDHGVRLIGLIMLVAILLEWSKPEVLLAGLHGAMRPLRVLGIDRSRAAIRLALVLRYAEQPLPRHIWRDWLQAPLSASDGVAVRIPRHDLGWPDCLAAGALIAACAFAVAA